MREEYNISGLGSFSITTHNKKFFIIAGRYNLKSERFGEDSFNSLEDARKALPRLVTLAIATEYQRVSKRIASQNEIQTGLSQLLLDVAGKKGDFSEYRR